MQKDTTRNDENLPVWFRPAWNIFWVAAFIWWVWYIFH